METILSVRGLTKKYEKFTLDNVSFDLEYGYIMGFIGSNGAGKTTTLKSILNLVHSDGGTVEICGKNFSENELECKQEVGLVFGGVDYYPKAKLRDIANITKRFYKSWDNEKYQNLLVRFSLDEDKKIDELSAGMRVKFSLSLALSHNARLLILDEPTSGLDPVSRDDLLELFQEIIEDGEHSILFSTHIISDLEKCSDYITYIKNGKIIKSCDKDSFTEEYRLVQGSYENLTASQKEKLIGLKTHAFGFTGMIKTDDKEAFSEYQIAKADLESVMIYFEKE